MLSDTENLVLMHAASLIGVLALAIRNQLGLRSVLFVSIALNIVDHVFVRGGGNPNVLFWDTVALATNAWVTTRLVLDRTHIGLSAEEERLFLAWGSLTPGEFRALLKLARWCTAEASLALTTEDVAADQLFFVLDGAIALEKAGRTFALDAPAFIGEVAFVKDRPASATATIPAGTRYLAWPSAALRTYFVKHGAMRVAVMRLLSADMAAKVARA